MSIFYNNHFLFCISARRERKERGDFLSLWGERSSPPDSYLII